MHSTKYIVGFVTVLTAIVAIVLSVLFSAWQPQVEINKAIFNKRAILSAVKDYLGDKDPKKITDQEVLDIFDNQVTQVAVDMKGNVLEAADIQAAGYNGGKAEDIDLSKEKKKSEADRILPLYTFNYDKGSLYIVSVRGNGLWDEIWGNIALEPNFSTIAGASFDHAGETPGLGAEIKDNPSFPAKLKNKELFTSNGDYVGVSVVKNGAKNDPHKIDGISGATVTCVGVGEMLYRGINYYEPYFAKLKAGQGKSLGMLSK